MKKIKIAKSYTQASLDTIQTNIKRQLAQNIAALNAWKKVKHLTKKDGTEFKFISKSFENAKIDYDFSGRPVLKVYFHDDYNGYSNDEIWLYDSYDAHSKTQKYPESTYINESTYFNRVHYLTPLEAMEVVSEKIKCYEDVINEKKETLEKLEALYIEYTSKLKTLYNEALDKCGDNRQLKSSMKEALKGVRVY